MSTRTIVIKNTPVTVSPVPPFARKFPMSPRETEIEQFQASAIALYSLIQEKWSRYYAGLPSENCLDELSEEAGKEERRSSS